MALGEKERLLREVEKEREVWRQRDRALATVLQEKDQLTQNLRQQLERCQVMLAGRYFPVFFLFVFYSTFSIGLSVLFSKSEVVAGFHMSSRETLCMRRAFTNKPGMLLDEPSGCQTNRLKKNLLGASNFPSS